MSIFDQRQTLAVMESELAGSLRRLLQLSGLPRLRLPLTQEDFRTWARAVRSQDPEAQLLQCSLTAQVELESTAHPTQADATKLKHALDVLARDLAAHFTQPSGFSRIVAPAQLHVQQRGWYLVLMAWCEVLESDHEFVLTLPRNLSTLPRAAG